MSNETYKLSEDLRWLEQQATNANDTGRQCPAEGFTKEHLGKELKEGRDFEIVNQNWPNDKLKGKIRIENLGGGHAEMFAWIAVPLQSLVHNGDIFNEQSLRDEIIKVWGDHGAHLEVYDNLLKNKNNE